MLNQRFHHCLSQCKQLHAQSLSRDGPHLTASDSVTAQLTADKILYNHAIDLVIFVGIFVCVSFPVSRRIASRTAFLLSIDKTFKVPKL